MEQLYVDPDGCGRGVGSAMVRLAKARYPDGLQLWTFASNIGARRFYERNGFAEVERTDGQGNEEGEPDVRYRWTPPARRRLFPHGPCHDGGATDAVGERSVGSRRSAEPRRR